MTKIPDKFKNRLYISSKELEHITGWSNRKQYDLRKQYPDMPFAKIGKSVQYIVPDIFIWLTKYHNPNYKERPFRSIRNTCRNIKKNISVKRVLQRSKSTNRQKQQAKRRKSRAYSENTTLCKSKELREIKKRIRQIESKNNKAPNPTKAKDHLYFLMGDRS